MSKQKKTLTRIGSVVLLLTLFATTAYAINLINEGFKILKGSRGTRVSVHSACKTVTNNDSDKDVFIPTNSPNEWNTFLTNKPSYISLGGCTAIPTAPTDIVASPSTRGAAQVTVSFNAPDDGGSPITRYTVASNPGGITVAGVSSPITVVGLNKGTAYTFSVTATNDEGTGPAGNSNSATPTGSFQALTFQTAATGDVYTCTPYLAPKPQTLGTIRRYIPFVNSVSYQAAGYITDKLNYTGYYASKDEAVRASISSLESCLSANGYITPFTIGTQRICRSSSSCSTYPINGFGLNPNQTCTVSTGARSYAIITPNKSWIYKDVNQVTQSYNNNTGAYTYSGTARQVTYGDLSKYDAAPDYTKGNGCTGGIYPDSVSLHTAVCSGQSNPAYCSNNDVTLSTSLEN